MIALHPPFRAENMEGLYNKVIKGEYPKISSKYSNDIAQMIDLEDSNLEQHQLFFELLFEQREKYNFWWPSCPVQIL